MHWVFLSILVFTPIVTNPVQRHQISDNLTPSYERQLQANLENNGWFSVCFMSLLATISGWFFLFPFFWLRKVICAIFFTCIANKDYSHHCYYQPSTNSSEPIVQLELLIFCQEFHKIGSWYSSVFPVFPLKSSPLIAKGFVALKFFCHFRNLGVQWSIVLGSNFSETEIQHYLFTLVLGKIVYYMVCNACCTNPLIRIFFSIWITLNCAVRS